MVSEAINAPTSFILAMTSLFAANTNFPEKKLYFVGEQTMIVNRRVHLDAVLQADFVVLLAWPGAM